jgi:hypothetical protein
MPEAPPGTRLIRVTTSQMAPPIMITNCATSVQMSAASPPSAV